MKNPLKAVIAEMKNVVWPTRKELVVLLAFTIVVCTIAAVLMLGLDVFFIEIRDYLLKL